MRDDFTEETKHDLAGRVGGRCSNPDCRASTHGPQAGLTGFVNVGVAAHVTAASPGGPRYAPSLSPQERRHPSNGLWLCQNCAKRIDGDTEHYPVSVLRSWKARAEASASASVGRPAARLETDDPAPASPTEWRSAYARGRCRLAEAWPRLKRTWALIGHFLVCALFLQGIFGLGVACLLCGVHTELAGEYRVIFAAMGAASVGLSVGTQHDLAQFYFEEGQARERMNGV